MIAVASRPWGHTMVDVMSVPVLKHLTFQGGWRPTGRAEPDSCVSSGPAVIVAEWLGFV